jgi:peptidyl-prolyl cis-trans isomerase C
LQIDLELSGQTPSDDQLRAYFSAHRDKYVDPAAMRLQHVVVLLDAQHSAKQALDIAQQMAEALRKKGAPSATFVKFGAKEIDGTAAAVIPDSVVKAALGAKLYEVASGLGSGDVSTPVPLTDGIHVLLMLQRQPSRALEFDQARSVVDKDFKREAREQAQREYVSVLRKKAEIEVDRAQLQ